MKIRQHSYASEKKQEVNYETVKLEPLQKNRKRAGFGLTVDELVNQAFKVSNEYKILDESTMKELNEIGIRVLTKPQADMVFIINERNRMLVGTK